EKAERGGECVDGVNPRSTLAPTDHTAELHPRPDETPVGEEGERGRQDKEEEAEKEEVSESTKAQGEQVEQSEEDQGTDGTPSRSCTDGKQ
ncbi:hypothetical protein M9458_028988, partial [Cirrhinus mrigala]